MIVVRKSEPRDAQALIELIHDHASFERANATISLARLKEFLAESGAPVIFFVAECDNKLEGYASLTFDYATWRGTRFGHLDCLFVRETQRSRGIGKNLFRLAVEAARDSGADRLEWQTPDWNSDAIRFYNREGGIAETKQRFALDLAESDKSQQAISGTGSPKT